MKKIIFALIFVTLLAAAYFYYPTIKGWFSKSSSKIILNKTTDQENGSRLPNEESQSGNADTEIRSSSLNISVSPSDCDTDCAEFKKSEDLKYCQEACGLSSEQPTDNCQNKTGLEKDYCLKDLAVKNQDFKTCDKISDSGIKKACNNRITEDIIENQGGL